MSMSKIEKTVDNIINEVQALHAALDDIELELNNILSELGDLSPNALPVDTPPLDAIPYTLERGKFKGYTALRWPSGAFVHNDWALDPESVVGTYEFHGIKKENRVPY